MTERRFLQELKRRNVFRVGLAYVVGAWLLLQLAEVLKELLDLPQQVGPIVVALVAIGFPIALFLAWAYELTPSGIRRETDVPSGSSFTRATGRKLNGLITVMLAVAVAFLLLDRFLPDEAPVISGQMPSESAQVPETDETMPAVPRQSIAVLPFTNRSPVAEDEFFIDGIHDDLLTSLARISGLKVISRTSVARFRGTDTPLPEIARQLGVATVMEGAVQRAGDMVRINVQLIDAASDEHLWAQIYDRPLTTDNLFAIQSEIAEMIAASLQATLTPAEQQQLASRPTDSLDAYSAYLRGHRDFMRREIESMNRALAEFRQAVALDPEFAQAWAGIAQVALILPSWSLMSKEEALAIAEPATERALALAPDLGEAHLALALLMQFREEDAEDQFQRAIALLPNDPKAYQWFGNYFELDPERADDATALFLKAIELDPLSPLFRHQYGRFLMFIGHFEEADREFAIINTSDPDFFGALEWRSNSQEALGHLDQAVAWNTRARAADPQSPFHDVMLATWAYTLGDRNRVVEIITRLAGQDATSPFFPFIEATLADMDGNTSGAIEVLASIRTDEFQNMSMGWRSILYAYQGDWAETRALQQQLNPDYFNAETRSDGLKQWAGDACLAGYALMKTGDVEQGTGLVRDAIDHATRYLPQYVRHAAYTTNLHHCLAVNGDHEASLTLMELFLEHRHFDFWFGTRRLEYFAPLQGNPRFEALMQQVDEEMARQRANLAQLVPLQLEADL